MLPVVRRAFSGWEGPERQALATKAANLDTTSQQAFEPDLEEPEPVLAAADRILEAAR